IESGIDMPTVNTLVVDRADRLGLGQLHQLRGRVGRAGQRAYAYLFFPPDRSLTEEAYERLRTIGEHTELGSGFKIAMRVLEIRVTPARPGGISAGQPVARISPLSLKASTQVGLRRRHPGAVYKEDLSQVVVPLQRGVDVPDALVTLLGELVPDSADGDGS